MFTFSSICITKSLPEDCKCNALITLSVTLTETGQWSYNTVVCTKRMDLLSPEEFKNFVAATNAEAIAKLVSNFMEDREYENATYKIELNI